MILNYLCFSFFTECCFCFLCLFVGCYFNYKYHILQTDSFFLISPNHFRVQQFCNLPFWKRISMLKIDQFQQHLLNCITHKASGKWKSPFIFKFFFTFFLLKYGLFTVFLQFLLYRRVTQSHTHGSLLCSRTALPIHPNVAVCLHQPQTPSPFLVHSTLYLAVLSLLFAYVWGGRGEVLGFLNFLWRKLQLQPRGNPSPQRSPCVVQTHRPKSMAFI